MRVLQVTTVLIWGALSQCAGASCDPIVSFAHGKTPLREVFVSPQEDDNLGDGTLLRPFRTLRRAARNARVGDALRLLPGSHQAGNLLSDLNGTANNPIWLGGPPGDEPPVIEGGRMAIHVVRARYLVVEHMVIVGATANGINCDDGGDRSSPEITQHLEHTVPTQP